MESLPVLHPKRFGTSEEVAEYRNTTTRRMAQERYLGTGPAYIKDGRKILYEWDAVDAYLADRTVLPQGE